MDLGSGILISSAVQAACRYSPYMLESDQAYASGFCLTTDQLFCFHEKLSCRCPQINLKFVSLSFPRCTAARRVVFMNILQIAKYIFKYSMGSPGCFP